MESLGYFRTVILVTTALITTTLQLNDQGTRLFHLGTLLVSDSPPSNTRNPLQEDSQCDEHSCTGRVWIYYSDSDEAAQWGTIDRAGIDVYGRQIICRQLGYKYHNNTEIAAPFLNDSDIPIWIKRAYCGDIPETTDAFLSNILECGPQLCDQDECTHDTDLAISCYSALTEEDRYDGEVYLCPPKEKPYGMQATLGIIEIQHHNKSKSISINRDSDVVRYFEDRHRNSFCRHLGFSRPVSDSIFTLSVLSEHYDFTHCPNSSWFDVNALHRCDAAFLFASTPCFGCCYKYPPIRNCQDCNDEDTVLSLGCEYAPLNKDDDPKTKGSQDLCVFQDKKLVNGDIACDKYFHRRSHCGGGAGGGAAAGNGTVIVAGATGGCIAGILVLLFLLLICCCGAIFGLLLIFCCFTERGEECRISARDNFLACRDSCFKRGRSGKESPIERQPILTTVTRRQVQKSKADDETLLLEVQERRPMITVTATPQTVREERTLTIREEPVRRSPVVTVTSSPQPRVERYEQSVTVKHEALDSREKIFERHVERKTEARFQDTKPPTYVRAGPTRTTPSSTREPRLTPHEEGPMRITQQPIVSVNQPNVNVEQPILSIQRQPKVLVDQPPRKQPVVERRHTVPAMRVQSESEESEESEEERTTYTYTPSM